MAVSRQELQRRLAKLEADMPELMASYPDRDDFLAEFFARAYSTIDAITLSEDALAFNEIDRILQKFGYRARGDN
jgi:hypothetical protein